MKYANEQDLRELTDYLRRGDLTSFERTFKRLADDGFLIDLSQIHNVERLVSNLYISHLQNAINIDGMLHTLKFANSFDLLAKTPPKSSFNLNPRDLDLIKINLSSLFGDYSDGFLNYNLYYLPDHLAQFIMSANIMFIDNRVSLPDRIRYIHSIVDNVYSVGSYGLRSRKIGTFHEYFQTYESHKKEVGADYYRFEINQTDLVADQDPNIMVNLWFELSSLREEHLIYEPLLLQVKEKYEQMKYHYEYPIISMVTLGGIGPEGKGFVYLTPRGNIVEVCSDAKQTKAYVIEYKKYLKNIFLRKLENQMESWDISDVLKQETIKFFDANIHVRIVDFDKIESININQILNFMPHEIDSQISPDFLMFLKKSLLDIFFPMQMEDQFKVRMDLIKNNKLTETEIAKLASLGNISHYDVLDQRFFFLNQIENLARILKITL